MLICKNVIKIQCVVQALRVFSLAGNGRMDGQTDRQTDRRMYKVIIVNNCRSRNLLRQRSHCRAIVYEHHD